MGIKVRRTAREIKVCESLIDNKNMHVKIGAVENRDSPDTIYLFISFWVKPAKKMLTQSQDELKKILNEKLGNIYKKELAPYLKSNKYFINEKDNIYIKSIPENINYNNKRNFISLELYLHTSNIISSEKLPLSVKKNTEIFNEAVNISNIIGNSIILNSGEEFELFKKSMG